jgi:pimeloyl-ACP methyl ester carboxylesterase
MTQTFAERRWTSPDGLTLFARDYAAASGPAKLPVIAIHGLTRNSADFEAIAPLIAQSGRRVLAIDVRGRGRSDRAPDPMTYQPLNYAHDVLALLDQAGIARAVFLGTSMGGLITMALAALRSKAIAAAILNDVGPEVAKEGLMRIAAYSGQPVDTPGWAEAAAYVKSINGAAFPHYTDADWDAFARRTFKIGTEGAPVLNYDPDIAVPIKAAGPKALVPNLWPMFSRLAKARPVLLVRGQTSDLLSEAIAAKMQKRAPKMDYVEVPGVGHAPMLDEPEAKAAIFPFLGEVD